MLVAKRLVLLQEGVAFATKLADITCQTAFLTRKTSVVSFERAFSGPESLVFVLKVPVFAFETSFLSLESCVSLTEAAVLPLEFLVCGRKRSVFLLEFLDFGFERVHESLFTEDITGFDIFELPAGRWGSMITFDQTQNIKIIINNVYSLSGCCFLTGTVVTVMVVVVVVMGLTNLKLVYKLPSFSWWSIAFD